MQTTDRKLAMPSTAHYILDQLADALLHAYPRYGLAFAAFQSHLADSVTEEELRGALARAIETGLEGFRMRTWNNPEHDETLLYQPVSYQELSSDLNLVQSAGLAAKGIYLFPSVVSIDGGAKETFAKAVEAISHLKSDCPLSKVQELSRSFAPTTGKINNGTASQTPPKGTLLEAACAMITTLTPVKPAAWPEINTTIIPDLPFPQLQQFIAVFDGMQKFDTDMNELMTATRRNESTLSVDEETKKVEKKKTPSGYRRPKLHSGNYPDAPREAKIFGAVGLLAAIGRWGRRTQETKRARYVLKNLAENPLFLISYDAISQVRFNHHLTRLAAAHDLTAIIDALFLETRLYPDAGKTRQDFKNPSFQTFCMMANRFLQSFSPPAFADFLAFRAEYPQKIQPIFNEYFQTMKPEIVHAAGELGQWINSTAYWVASNEVKKQEESAGRPLSKEERAKKEREGKAKLLVEIESAAFSAKSPAEMLSQTVMRVGRLLGQDPPAESRPYFDAVFAGDITHDEAKHLLLAYMRLRGPAKSLTPTGVENVQSGEESPTYNPAHDNN